MHGVTLAQGIGNAFYAATVLVFKWVPSVVISLYATDSLVTNPNTVVPITQPVTVGDATQYISSIAPPETYIQFMVLWGIYVAFSIFISIILIAIIVYCYIRMKEIHHAEHDRFHHSATHAHDNHIEVNPSKKRWNHIMELANGAEPSGWRVAILEADIMLGDLLDTLGYKGETMGDKMKIVNRSQFNTIDLAWEAHRTRNRVAHEGSKMVLTEREVQQTISHYAEVFKEFNII